MLYGIVLGKKIWDVDVSYSKFWAPDKYGVAFDKFIDNPADLINKNIDVGKYKFLVVSDVWTINTRKAIAHAKSKGLKIFLLPRETFNVFDNLLFRDKMFMHKGACYLTPDVVLAPGSLYRDMWADKTIAHITGHPRFDYCLDKNSGRAKRDVVEEYGLSTTKKLLFFPSYPIFHLNNIGSSRGDLADWQDVFDEREKTFESLVSFAKSRSDVQVVVKIHPSSSAIFKKRGMTKDMEGLTRKYLNNPTDCFCVIDGGKKTRFTARDILVAADAVVGGNSTMMVEGAVIGKPVVRVLFDRASRVVNMPGYEEIFVTAVGDKEIQDELNKVMDNLVKNYNDEGLCKYIYQIDGQSCARICDAIKKECGQK